MARQSEQVLDIRNFLSQNGNDMNALSKFLLAKYPITENYLCPAAKKELFLAYCQPDKNGCTRRVFLSELNAIYPGGFIPGNGCDWARDGVSLGREFKIKRYDRAGKQINNGNAVYSIELVGHNNSKFKQTIPAEVRWAYKGRCCVRCSSRYDIQMDHKAGLKLKTAKRVEDYQPLCRDCNDEKREWCKQCKRTGQRPDPREVLADTWWGNCPVGWIKGNRKLNRSLANPCEGCFCYDFLAFGAVAWRMRA